jgi:starvation-inducible DNA-binding protein
MHNTRIDLSAEKREAAIRLLSDRLADLIDLQLQTKQAHWNVKGPNFIAIHELFDDIAGEIEEHVDAVAERITAFGGTAEGTLAAVGKRTSLAPYPLNISSSRDHLDALATAVSKAGKAIRAAIDQSDEIGDKGTSDLFTGISRDLDKKLWFLESHLQG